VVGEALDEPSNWESHRAEGKRWLRPVHCNQRGFLGGRGDGKVVGDGLLLS
jgi:hypothetical protein